jgi:RNA polymerase sigma factor (sigma-70 family)
MRGLARAAPVALVDATSSYFTQMGAVPLLTPASELALARRIEASDRKILVALLDDRCAVDELLRVAREGTTTRTLAADVLIDIDGRHVDFDEAARKRELGDVLVALQRYRDAQERGRDLDGARERLLARLSRQWFRGRVLRLAAAKARTKAGARPTDGALMQCVRRADNARAAMLRGNLRLVVSLARQYRNRGVELLDLVQEGNLGLMTAIDRFDHRRGYRLATYATWWIRNAVARAVAEAPRTIRVPGNVCRALGRVAEATRKLTHTLGRVPGEEEIALCLGVAVECVRIVGAVPAQPVSLETPVGFDEGTTLQDLVEDRSVASPTQALEAAELAKSVRSALSVLTDREAKVVRMHFGIGKPSGDSLEEIGALFGVSRERIRQIEESALAKLRRRRVAGRLRPHLET